MGFETDRLGRILAAALAAAALLGVVVALLARAPTALAGVVGLIPAALVALVAAVQLRLRERERDERRERERAQADHGHRLFEDEARFLDAGRSREQFERFAVPGFCVLLAAVEGALGRWVQAEPPLSWATLPAQQALFIAALLAAVAFVAFVTGRLVGALAEEREAPLLQPAADWLLLTAGMALLGAVATLLGRTTMRGQATWAPAPQVMAATVAVGFWIAAADQLVTLALEAYRARMAGLGERAPYETRLLHLVTHPRGLVGNLAGTLDYQFGWSVSGTDLYRAAGRALLPLVLLQLTALWLLSSFAFLGPAEQGLRERFGRPVAQPVVGPGLHLVWPWPVEHVRRYPASRVQALAVGWEPQGDEADQAHEGGAGVVAWGDAHDGGHEPFLVATAPADDTDRGVPPVSLISVAIEVHYRVTDLPKFVYGFRDGAALLDDLARREATRLLVGSDVVALMGTGRAAAGAELRDRLAQRCDELGLGVELLFVGFLGAHPPAPVMPAYEEVTAAAEQSEAEVLQAEAAAVAALSRAKATATARQAQAEGEGYRRGKVAQAEAARFTGVLDAAHAAPEVYRTRRAVDARREALRGRPKIIVAAEGANEVITVDLHEKAEPDLLDTPLPPAEETKHD